VNSTIGPSTTKISAVDFRQNARTHLDDAQFGKTFVITRYGRPIARLVPMQSQESHAEGDFMPAFKTIANELGVGGFVDTKQVLREFRHRLSGYDSFRKALQDIHDVLGMGVGSKLSTDVLIEVKRRITND